MPIDLEPTDGYSIQGLEGDNSIEDTIEKLVSQLKAQQILTKNHTVWTGDRINGNAASSVKSNVTVDYCVDNSNVKAGYDDVKKSDQININHKLFRFTADLMKKNKDPLRSFLGAYWFPTYELGNEPVIQGNYIDASSEESRDFVIGGHFFPFEPGLTEWHKYDQNKTKSSYKINNEKSTFFPFIPLQIFGQQSQDLAENQIGADISRIFKIYPDELVATMMYTDYKPSSQPGNLAGMENFRTQHFTEKIKVGMLINDTIPFKDRMDHLLGKMFKLAATIYDSSQNNDYFSDYVTEIGLPFSPKEANESPVQMAKITQSSKGNFFPQDYLEQLDNSPDDEHFYPDYATHLISEANKGQFSGNTKTYNDAMKIIVSLNDTIPKDVIDKFSILNNGKNSNINMEELGQYFNSWASAYNVENIDDLFYDLLSYWGKNKIILPEAMKYIRANSANLGNINYPMLTSFDILMPSNPWPSVEFKQYRTYLYLLVSDLLWPVLNSMYETALLPTTGFKEFNGTIDNSGDIRPGFMTKGDTMYIWPPISYGQNQTSGPIQNIKSIDFYNNRHIRDMMTPMGTSQKRGENASFLTALSEQPEDIYKTFVFRKNVLGKFDTESMLNIDSIYDDSELPSNLVDFLGSYAAGENQSSNRFLGKAAFRRFSEQGCTRNFTDVYNGEKAHSELIGYRVMKQRTDTNEVITNYFFLNDPDSSIKQIVDSQLGYSESYTYNVFGWYMVYGTEFEYSLDKNLEAMLRVFFNSPEGQPHADMTKRYSLDYKKSAEAWYAFREWWENYPFYTTQSAAHEFAGTKHVNNYPSEFTKDNSLFFDITVKSHPVVKFIELPIYMNLGGPAIVQDFPTTPTVEAVPYRNNNSDILFLINSGPDSSAGLPVQIEQSDYEHIFNKYKSEITSDKFEALKFISSINPNEEDSAADFAPYFLNYENTVTPKYFQIFRLDFKPTSYTDFQGTSLVETNGTPGLLTNGVSSTSFKDNIEPNRKYYYTFRSVDQFGHPSPPTAVYEIELVDDNGTIYPLINTVEFDSPAKKNTSSKTMRKYLHIAPALENTLLDNYASAPGLQGVETTAGKFIEAKGEPYLGSKDNFNLFDRQEDEDNQSIEGKREYYKIRLSSKKTGRQCDINVYFKTKHNYTKEEEKSKNNSP